MRDDTVRLLTDLQALAERRFLSFESILQVGVVDLRAQRAAGVGSGNRRVPCLGTLDPQGRQPHTYQQLATASLGRGINGWALDHVHRSRLFRTMASQRGNSA